MSEDPRIEQLANLPEAIRAPLAKFAGAEPPAPHAEAPAATARAAPPALTVGRLGPSDTK